MNVRNSGREDMTRRQLWMGRVVWAILALVGVGFLATSSPGPTLDVNGAPFLTLAVGAVIVWSYPKVIGLFDR